MDLNDLEHGKFDKKGHLLLSAQRTAFGELQVAEVSPIFQMSFEYTVGNTELNSVAVANGGTVTQGDSMGIVGTSGTTESTALLQSNQHARYRSGQGGLSRFTAMFTAPVANTEQLIGILDEVGLSVAFKNGYAIGYIGTVFGFHRFVNDTVVTIPIADWDDPLDGSGFSKMVIDLTKLNVFSIQFQYLGAGAIKIMVEDDSTGLFIEVHTVLYANNNIVPSVYNPNFFHMMWVNNGDTTSDMILKSGSFSYFVEGRTSFIELHQPQFSSGKRTKATVTSEVAIFTIRNKSLYVSKNNFIDILLQNISFATEASSANNLASIRLIKNATLGGTPSYSDIEATDSVVEIDTAGTTVANGKEIINVPLAGKNDKGIFNVTDLKIILNPGDTITLAGMSSNSATIDASILWKELF